jgi:hypothetical protein
MWHVGRIAEVHIGFLSEDMMERDILEDLDIYGTILKWLFSKWDGGQRLDCFDSG